MELDLKDIRVEVFEPAITARPGKKIMVKVLHIPTGHTVSVVGGSRYLAREQALSELQARVSNGEGHGRR